MSKVIAIIPARAGSKRLLGKNKKLLCGKPLICWTIEEALKCDFIDNIIVSTNDKEIINICVPYIERYYDRFKVIERPEVLCQDDTPMWKVIEHACLKYSMDTVVFLLQTTSPLRDITDLIVSYSMYLENGNCLVSVFNEDLLHYKLNGAIYIGKLSYILINNGFEARQLYIMPKERSVDIDTLDDFNECERILKERDKV